MRELIHAPILHSVESYQAAGTCGKIVESNENHKKAIALSRDYWDLTSRLFRTICERRVRVYLDSYYGPTKTVKNPTQVRKALEPFFGDLAIRGKYPDLEPIFLLAENCHRVVIQQTEKHDLVLEIRKAMLREVLLEANFQAQFDQIPADQEIPDEIFIPYKTQMRDSQHSQISLVDQRDNLIRPLINTTLKDRSVELGVLLMGAHHTAHTGLDPDIAVRPLSEEHQRFVQEGMVFVRKQRESLFDIE